MSPPHRGSHPECPATSRMEQWGPSRQAPRRPGREGHPRVRAGAGDAGTYLFLEYILHMWAQEQEVWPSRVCQQTTKVSAGHRVEVWLRTPTPTPQPTVPALPPPPPCSSMWAPSCPRPFSHRDPSAQWPFPSWHLQLLRVSSGGSLVPLPLLLPRACGAGLHPGCYTPWF